MGENEEYLENLMFIRRNKNLSFEALLNKIKGIISSWQIPLLSQADRNTLIKSVASVILVYNMSSLDSRKKPLTLLIKCSGLLGGVMARERKRCTF